MLILSLHGISKVVSLPSAVLKAGSKVAQELGLLSRTSSAVLNADSEVVQGPHLVFLMCAYACKMLPDAAKMGSSWIQLVI